MTIIVTTPVFKLAFPALFEPYKVPFEQSTFGPRYGGTMLFGEEADLTTLQQALLFTAKSRFSDKEVRDYVRMPIKPGRLIGKDLDFTGYRMVTAKSSQRPYCKDAVQEVENGRVFLGSKESFYPGVLCTAEVAPFAYDVQGHKGVGLAMYAITKIADVQLTAEDAALFAMPEDGLPGSVL